MEEVVEREVWSSQRETVCGGVRTGAARHAQIKDRGHAAGVAKISTSAMECSVKVDCF